MAFAFNLHVAFQKLKKISYVNSNEHRRQKSHICVQIQVVFPVIKESVNWLGQYWLKYFWKNLTIEQFWLRVRMKSQSTVWITFFIHKKRTFSQCSFEMTAQNWKLRLLSGPRCVFASVISTFNGKNEQLNYLETLPPSEMNPAAEGVPRHHLGGWLLRRPSRSRRQSRRCRRRKNPATSWVRPHKVVAININIHTQR